MEITYHAWDVDKLADVGYAMAQESVYVLILNFQDICLAQHWSLAQMVKLYIIVVIMTVAHLHHRPHLHRHHVHQGVVAQNVEAEGMKGNAISILLIHVLI